MGKWQRPASVPFPSVWHRFQGRKEINGVLPKFWVQDMPEDLYETAVDLMSNIYIKDEVRCKSVNAADDPELVQAFRQMWSDSLKAQLAIACFMENPDPKGKPFLAGINLTSVIAKGDKFPGFTCEKETPLLTSQKEVIKEKDPFEALGVNEYMGAFGLLILPEFRGQGLAVELLKARIPLCKAVGLKVTVSFFSSSVAQTSAERAGYKVLTELPFEELERRDPRIYFPNIEKYVKSLKFMYKWAD